MSGKVTRWEEATPVEMLPGVVRRTLGLTDRLMLLEIRLQAGATVPRHAHPHDQVGYVISGEVIFTIGDQNIRCGPGDGYAIPGGVEHAAHATVDAVLVEVFHPPREEYR